MAKAALDCAPLKSMIRGVPDFPKPGILFYDVTTLLKDKVGFARLIDALSEHYLDQAIDVVVGIEARGFIFGPALAYRLNAGLSRCANPKSCRQRLSGGLTIWSMAATPWKSTRMPSIPGDASLSLMTCWPPAAPPWQP